jgi:NAD(P)-dependent dehydrogenase (short-subunit alcohol dehydrogenase family)
VTGAASGLGKAKAEVLAADGAPVLIAAINRTAPRTSPRTWSPAATAGWVSESMSTEFELE